MIVLLLPALPVLISGRTHFRKTIGKYPILLIAFAGLGLYAFTRQ